ncbi:ABC transporter ATP-binding protein [Alsobacter metallidurans]|uniref:ABC transporter ATP-binding protein n=1 Tax=Alsobacter metallidurans TaxID=340221 RepID=A0A917MHY0_9HYPH|nr:ABC transporter ATP-binding protein [Alsobacter metallidurans]GGH20382.1 ABC transporter ATP-binding protein [Alsobacter metallidurans]
MTEPLLSVDGLTLALPEDADRPNAVTDVSFSVARGEIVCLVGESGSGKSICAQTLMGLLPPAIRRAGGAIDFEGLDLLALEPEAWRTLRGRRIAMIFQEPMTALNPVMRIGDQIAETFEAHGVGTPAERRERALALAGEVGLPDPARILQAYPHEISGGQRQRAMIAMALALEPALLVADEPTTALDVTTQAQILKLIRELQRRRRMGVVFITHDFGVVREIADTVVVLEKGRVVESGSAEEVLTQPRHPYTRALLDAIPSLDPAGSTRAEDQIVCDVAGLTKTYASRSGLFGDTRVVHAVKDVSFHIRRGETLGLVGESGSGKSTVARLVMRLLDPDRGDIRIGGADLAGASGSALRTARRRVQMVFQDPFASLNPRRRIGLSIADGPIASGTPRAVALEEARALLELVGLDPRAANRYPHEFSGGQRQRIGIARALALKPDLIVADEPVSALDVSVQKHVLGLLDDIKTRLRLSMLFITHDLHVAAQVCDRIAVMRRGEIVEVRLASELFASPEHPYTRELLAAALSLPPRLQ